jgi:hypothetical protein
MTDHDIENQIDSIISQTTSNLTNNLTDSSDTVSGNANNINQDVENSDIDNDTAVSDTTVSDTESYPELDEDSTQAFNICLQQYLAIENEKEIFAEAMKKRNQQKRNYEQAMITYLTRFNIKNIALDGTYKNKYIETDQKTSLSGFTRTAVIEVLQECIGHDSALFDKIMTKLQDKMTTKNIYKLKLIDTTKKKPNKKEKIKQNNENIDNVLENNESSIPENMKYLYENIDT